MLYYSLYKMNRSGVPLYLHSKVENLGILPATLCTAETCPSHE